MSITMGYQGSCLLVTDHAGVKISTTGKKRFNQLPDQSTITKKLNEIKWASKVFQMTNRLNQCPVRFWWFQDKFNSRAMQQCKPWHCVYSRGTSGLKRQHGVGTEGEKQHGFGVVI